ncbi:MAG TPA: hypothetical protein VJ455_01185 [Ignavibacteria bacterium]|nr:hypothetical protein [Ignavibacteria bacterium]
MNSGPSKEELENYWNTSRQYFDELARHYQTADPEYYRKFIAPFYSNPLYSVSQSKGGSRAVPLVVLSIAILVLGLVAGAVFFLLQFDEEKTIQQESPKIEKTIEKEEKIPKVDSVSTIEKAPLKKDRNRKEPIKRVR